MLAAAYCESLVEFHVGWSGWTSPPTMGGAGVATSEQVCEGVEVSER